MRVSECGEEVTANEGFVAGFVGDMTVGLKGFKKRL